MGGAVVRPGRGRGRWAQSVSGANSLLSTSSGEMRPTLIFLSNSNLFRSMSMKCRQSSTIIPGIKMWYLCFIEKCSLTLNQNSVISLVGINNNFSLFPEELPYEWRQYWLRCLSPTPAPPVPRINIHSYLSCGMMHWPVQPHWPGPWDREREQGETGLGKY